MVNLAQELVRCNIATEVNWQNTPIFTSSLQTAFRAPVFAPETISSNVYPTLAEGFPSAILTRAVRDILFNSNSLRFNILPPVIAAHRLIVESLRKLMIPMGRGEGGGGELSKT